MTSAALQREKHAHILTLTQSINTLDLYGEQLLFLFISNTAHPFTHEILAHPSTMRGAIGKQMAELEQFEPKMTRPHSAQA